LGLQLWLVKEHLRDLASDHTLPEKEREITRGFYTHEREKLHLRLAILDKKEKAESDEGAQSGLPTASAALVLLFQDDSRWRERQSEVRRWELSRGWEAITPDELRPAVDFVRCAFESFCWQANQSTMKLCYAALHPALSKDCVPPNSEDLEPYRRFLVARIGPRVQHLLLGPSHPAPVIFKSYLDVLETALKAAVPTHFSELYEIAKVRAELLNMHPVEWAKRHVEILIYAQKVGVTIWIRQVCDYPDTFRATCEDDLYGGAWRAPRFIQMPPSGNTRYDLASAWTREGLARSFELLDALSSRLTTFVSFELEKKAGAAHVEFVKQTGVKQWVSRQEERQEDLTTKKRRKPGRIPKPHQAFVVCAGMQWRAAISDSHTKVSDDQLQQIASALDAAGHLPPALYLEGKCAHELKDFNSRNSNSKIGPVKTWSRLVSIGDKDLLRGARRLFSRCAKKLDDHHLSGN
jgi:hypothetical protein